MPAGPARRARRRRGPAVLSDGFRPFFLAGALWAAAAMALWTLMLAGGIDLPTRFDPVSWHAHEFLFGYLGAIIAGFLLTAVPNWTGRLPVVGCGLGGLAFLWLAGRLGIALSAGLPRPVAALLDLGFPVALGAVILREIIAGRNARNLPIVGLLAVFAVANALFHWEAAHGGVAAGGYGLRLGLATALTMIALIGGRVVPSFTRNWLVRTGDTARPVPPIQGFDTVVMLATIAALLLWVVWPSGVLTGVALLVGGALQLLRLARWAGWKTMAEPLVWVLHAGYGFLPIGAVAMGLAILVPAGPAPAIVQHFWMVGAIGLMTLAVMTRASLGHSGRDLHAGAGTRTLYLLLVSSLGARLAADAWPGLHFLTLAGLLWIAAFGGFAALYGPMLVMPKTKGAS